MDGKTPLVSVVMSVYNGGLWTKTAIESVIHQTYTNWEFVIIDDASSDETRSILAAYASDPKFKIITNSEQKGLTKNLNIGIKASNGELIARMDADDICMPGRFAKQVKYLLDHKDVAVISGFVELIDEDGNEKGQWQDDREANSWMKIKRALPWKNCIAHPAVMMRKNIFEKYKYNETQRSSQDWDLWLQLAANNVIIEKIDEPLLLYRVHSKSITAGSLRKSAYRKIHIVIKKYLLLVWQQKKFNSFNLEVFFAFFINAVKLFFSTIKRSLTS
jgi:glycosyltransferase involved in cell wall biosynthesis